MIKKYMGSILLVMVFIICVSCIRILGKSELAEYHGMVRAYNDMNFTLEVGNYEEAVLFLVSTDVIFKEEIRSRRIKFSEVVSESLMDRLESQAISESKHSVSDIMEDLTNIEEEYEGEYVYEEGGLYPIYGRYFEVVEYGTKEESDRSLEYLEEQEDNDIIRYSIFKDTIIYKIDNKYTGEYMLAVNIKDSKISDFNILR